MERSRLIELTESEVDHVAGGTYTPHFSVNIGNWVSQTNLSFNQTSAGNNNNGISGNQVAG